MIIRQVFVFIFFFVAIDNSVLAEENTVILKKPPTTIKNWYKPNNKRQVWLHTMFRLRREILAINDYSQSQQPELMKKWFNNFKKDYLSIGEMVPQWKNSLDSSTLTDLQLAVEKGDYTKILGSLNGLKDSCDNCHSDYQAITRLLYRGADFAKIKVYDTETAHKIDYNKAMNGLSNTVNRIKIAMHDNLYPQSIAYIAPLKSQLKNLADGCGDCHKQGKEQIDYIFTASTPILSELKEALEQKDNKKARLSLGTFAVKVCARCHSIHRTTAEIKELIE